MGAAAAVLVHQARPRRGRPRKTPVHGDAGSETANSEQINSAQASAVAATRQVRRRRTKSGASAADQGEPVAENKGGSQTRGNEQGAVDITVAAAATDSTRDLKAEDESGIGKTSTPKKSRKRIVGQQ